MVAGYGIRRTTQGRRNENEAAGAERGSAPLDTVPFGGIMVERDSAVVAHQAHNLGVVGSNPAPATKGAWGHQSLGWPPGMGLGVLRSALVASWYTAPRCCWSAAGIIDDHCHGKSPWGLHKAPWGASFLAVVYSPSRGLAHRALPLTIWSPT